MKTTAINILKNLLLIIILCILVIFINDKVTIEWFQLTTSLSLGLYLVIDLQEKINKKYENKKKDIRYTR